MKLPKAEKLSDYTTATDKFFVQLSIMIMLVIALLGILLEFWDEWTFVAYLGIWITIEGAIVSLHIRIRIYRELDQKKEDKR